MDTHHGVPFLKSEKLDIFILEFWIRIASYQINLETEIKKNNFDPEKGNNIALVWQENKSRNMCCRRSIAEVWQMHLWLCFYTML